MSTTRPPADLAAPGAPSDNESETAVVRTLAASGFPAGFRPAREPVEGRPALTCGACGQSSPAADLAVEEERRLEGASDPDDTVLVVAGCCPACGAGGTIVLAYGPNASDVDADLVLAMDGGSGPVADPGGDSDPDANDGSEPKESGPEEDPEPGPSGLGRLGAALDRADGLDRVADPIRRTIDDRLPDPVRSLLQGDWLGHPLHPMLTDLTIGFWTSAWLLDLFGDERTDGASDAFVAAGLATAIPTAVSGWADWVELPRDKRRAGVVHAASNGLATALYGASLIARRRGSRGVGVGLAHAGAALATMGGFLGGHLVFGD